MNQRKLQPICAPRRAVLQHAMQVTLVLALVLAACTTADARSIPTAAVTAPAPSARAVTNTPEPTETAAAVTNTPTVAFFTSTSTAAPTATATPTLAPGWVRVPAGAVQVPILMYHHISDKINTRYALPVSTFRAQMKLLHEQGYQTVSISQLAGIIRNGGALPEKAVVITFDDGYLDTYANAFPIMQEYGFTGVAYIITATFEEGRTYGYMQKPELAKLVRAGWEIGSHSLTHTNLKETKLGLSQELEQSRDTLEDLLGVPVRSFSYPFAVSTESIRAEVEAAGYESAVGVDILVTNTPKRLYFLSRREVTRSLTLADFPGLLTPTADEIAWLKISQTPEDEEQ